jgi:hypothetical protein
VRKSRRDDKPGQHKIRSIQEGAVLIMYWLSDQLREKLLIVFINLQA